MTRRRWPRVLALLATVLVLALAAVLALPFTERGSRLLLDAAVSMTRGQLSYAGMAGSLAGGELRFDRLAWTTDTLAVTADDLALRWRPAALAERRLHVDRLAVTRLAVRSVPSDEPVQAPVDLRLPLAVELSALEVDELSVASGEAPPVVLAGLRAAADSDGAKRHHVRSLALESPWGRMALEGSLGAASPFALQASATLSGEWPAALQPLPGEGTAPRVLSGRLALSGDLLAPRAALEVDGGVVAARVQALLHPFAPQPLGTLDLTADGLDPADFVRDGPRARLSLRAQLQPVAADGAPAWALEGPVSVTNLAPGLLDAGRLPLREARARLAWRDGRMHLDALALDTPGGTLAGEGSLTPEGRAALTLATRGLDLRALHGALQSTRLDGEATLTVADGEGRVQANLSQAARGALPAVAARLVASRSADGRVRLEESLLSLPGRSDGRLTLAGELDPAGERAFRLVGQLVAFDPSAFVRMPRARLDADLQAQGRLQGAGGPALRLELRLLEASRLDGRPLGGSARLQVAGTHVEEADVDLDLAGNRLEARGTWGRPGDVLTWRVDAPALARLGLSGALVGQGRLAGTPQAPAGEATLRAERLGLPGGVRLERADLEGALRADGAFDATLVTRALRGADRTLADAATARLTGTLAAHRLTLTASGLEGGSRLDLLATGGWQAATRSWRGQLDQAELQGPEGVRLLDPVPVLAAPDRFQAGPARIGTKRAGSVVLDDLSWTAATGLASRGRFADAPLPDELGEVFDLARSTLRLAGEWTLRLPAGAPPQGQVRVARTGGDLVPGGGVPLGLSELSVDVRTAAAGLEARLTMNGSRSGSVQARAGARLRPQGDGWALALDGPLNAEARIDMPDLAWLGPLAGPGVRVAGRLAGQLRAAGTPRDPRLSGRIDADALEIALLDQGVTLADGLARIVIDDSLLTLTEARFTSPIRVRPDDRRIPADLIDAQLGVLRAQGSIRLDRALVEGGAGQGLIRVTFERFAALQARDRWLMASGWATLTLEPGRFELEGKATVDAASVRVDDDTGPALSNDVVVVRRRPPDATGRRQPATTVASGDAATHPKDAPRPAPPLNLRFDIETGERSYVRGMGLDTRLVGSLRITGRLGGELTARGIIETRGGVFRAYNQRLEIERGLLTFAGPIENPTLNVLAVRRGLPVTPGVEVTGAAQDPRIRIVSDPPLSEAEKISWLVLGYAPEQLSGREQQLLGQAALALLSGRDGGAGGPGRVLEDLGLDFNLRSTLSAGPGARLLLPGATLTGVNANAGVAGSIVSVGRRLSNRAYLSVEQSLTGSLTLVQLSLQLSRRLTAVARGGAENALDLVYAFGWR